MKVYFFNNLRVTGNPLYYFDGGVQYMYRFFFWKNCTDFFLWKENDSATNGFGFHGFL